jgi:glycosyltransferase involved in cell wall biosynthesis
MNDSESDFVVNASRISKQGGLRTYTKAVLECLVAQYGRIEAVLPYGVEAPSGVDILSIPKISSNSSRISKLRPLVWLTYATLLFPVKRSRRILCTTHHVLPFRKHQIVTVHDLRPYFAPDTWIQKFYFHLLLPSSLRRCDGILTVSETSKQQIIEVYGINPESIHVVPNAIVFTRRHIIAQSQVENTITPYLLMVGASWKHKNALEVLDQHAFWKHKFRLKIVARAGQYAGELYRRSLDLKIASLVDIIQDVTSEELDSLYQSCSALVYPSIMEGFGLPPLEAMAWGKPVIVSDIPVFRELLGTAPIFVRLGDPSSWKDAFAALTDQERAEEIDRIQERLSLASSYSLNRMCTALDVALKKIWHSPRVTR